MNNSQYNVFTVRFSMEIELVLMNSIVLFLQELMIALKFSDEYNAG